MDLYNKDLFSLGADSFVTFRRILSSLLQSEGVAQRSIVRLPPLVFEDIGEGEEDPQKRTELLTISLGEYYHSELICKVSWAGLYHRRHFQGELFLKFFYVDQSEEGPETRPALRVDLDLLWKLQNVMNDAINATLQTLQTRGLLKASREDLIAQLASPGKIRGSALALQGLQTRSGVHTTTPIASPSEQAYEDVIENFLPGNDTMYQNFTMKGGKAKRKSAKRSKKGCKQR